MQISAVSLAESVILAFWLNHISSSGEPMRYVLPSVSFCGWVYVSPSHAFCTASVIAGIATAASSTLKSPRTVL